jgi:hypothetical protein
MGWTEEVYADPGRYLRRRARLVRELGPPLRPGDTVLDLACADADFAAPLEAAGLRYRGVDLDPAMVAAAAGRAEEGDLNDYRPAGRVAATTCFRGLPHARERRSFFRLVASYTDVKLVLDVDPRRSPLDDVVADLAAAGFPRIELRPFFVPQKRRLPRPALWALAAAERIGPLARLILRRRFSVVVAASRDASPSTRRRTGRRAPARRPTPG